mmetsp:Transcript_65459/g.211047  ORF Transcript_65459/g.211047 Transcript_65459/m.211047 type:complete len:221 (+) Transcript_65459:246-908(+)
MFPKARAATGRMEGQGSNRRLAMASAWSAASPLRRWLATSSARAAPQRRRQSSFSRKLAARDAASGPMHPRAFATSHRTPLFSSPRNTSSSEALGAASKPSAPRAPAARMRTSGSLSRRLCTRCSQWTASIIKSTVVSSGSPISPRVCLSSSSRPPNVNRCCRAGKSGACAASASFRSWTVKVEGTWTAGRALPLISLAITRCSETVLPCMPTAAVDDTC